MTYQVWDKVIRWVHVLSDASERFNAKHGPKFEGPFAIKEIFLPTVYNLEPSEGRERRIAKIHASEREPLAMSGEADAPLPPPPPPSMEDEARAGSVAIVKPSAAPPITAPPNEGHTSSSALSEGDDRSIDSRMKIELLAPSTPDDEPMDVHALEPPLEAGWDLVAAVLLDPGPGPSKPSTVPEPMSCSWYDETVEAEAEAEEAAQAASMEQATLKFSTAWFDPHV